MRALAYDAFGGPLSVRSLPEPVAPAGGAVVRVVATGLCRSDWHGWMGHDSDIATFPHVPGHEFSGVVASVGSGVSQDWVGRSVTAPFVFACGTCPVCRAGDGQVCPDQTQPGFTHPGSYAEYVQIRSAATNLVALPAEVAPALAAGLGCRVATAYRAVTARAQVRAGDWVAVFGCGGVGLSVIAVALSRGASVVAVDVSESALVRARALGATEGLLADSTVVGRIHELTGGGANVAIEAIGSPAACRDSVLSLRRRGRQVQVGLLPPVAGAAPVPMERVIAWELDLLGSHGMAAADYVGLLDDLAAGRLVLYGLVDTGPALTLEEAALALPAMGEAPSSGIRVIDPAR